MHLQSVRHENQVFTYSTHTMRFPRRATDALMRILPEWQKVFPRENTGIQLRHGVPSLFVRFDCVLTSDGMPLSYEIQEGCAWVGYTGIANAVFRDVRDSIARTEWPGLKVLRSHRQTDTDDELWVPRIHVRDALASSDPLIMRSPLKLITDEERTALIKRSVRPVLTHNDKTYGERLGWWRMVRWEGAGTRLPWDSAFVLKPTAGHGSADIMIWKPDERGGRATRTQILRKLEKHHEMYLQPFYPPMQITLNGDSFNYIYRPYFIYSGSRGWVPAHGLWTARPFPALRIHGTSDAISGPLLME